MDQTVVFKSVRAFCFAPDHFRQLDELFGVAVELRRKFDDVSARGVAATGFFQIDVEFERFAVEAFDRADFNPAVRAFDFEAALVDSAACVAAAGADECGRVRVAEYGRGVVLRAGDDVGSRHQERFHTLRATHDRNDEVDQVTAQVEHDSAFEFGEVFLVLFAAVAVVHIHVDRENLAKRVFADETLNELKGRVAAVHVAHLEREVARFAAVEQSLVRRQFFSGGFVHVHGKAALHAPGCDGDKIIVRNLNRDGFEAGVIKRFVQSQFGDALITLHVGSVAETRRFAEGAFIDPADNVEVIPEQFERLDFAVRVFVADSDLNDFYWIEHRLLLFVLKHCFDYAVASVVTFLPVACAGGEDDCRKIVFGIDTDGLTAPAGVEDGGAGEPGGAFRIGHVPAETAAVSILVESASSNESVIGFGEESALLNVFCEQRHVVNRREAAAASEGEGAGEAGRVVVLSGGRDLFRAGGSGDAALDQPAFDLFLKQFQWSWHTALLSGVFYASLVQSKTSPIGGFLSVASI